MPLAQEVVAGLGTPDADRLPPAVRARAEYALGAVGDAGALDAGDGPTTGPPGDDVPSRAASLAVRAHAGHQVAGGRPEEPCGCAVAAAALGAAAIWDAAGSTVVGAVALALELQLRLDRALGPDHRAAGWDAAGTAGPPAAAFAAALVAGAGPDRVAHALGIATSLTLGLGEASGTDVGALLAGQVAANGLLAAALAVHGSTATDTAFEGPRGYFHVLGADAAAEGLLDGPGPQWLTQETASGPEQPGTLVAGLRDASPEQVRRLARRLLDLDGEETA